MRDGDNHLVVGIEIFGVEVACGIIDYSAARVAILGFDSLEFFAYYAAAFGRIRQNEFESGNLGHDFFIVGLEFALFELGKAAYRRMSTMA